VKQRWADGWNRHFLGFEALAVLTVGLLLVLAIELLVGHQPVANAAGRLDGAFLSTVAGIIGGLLGFTITTMSIVAGLVYSDRFELLRQSPHFVKVWRIFGNAIGWQTLFLTTALAGFFMPNSGTPFQILMLTMVPLVLAVAASLWRCIWLVRRVFEIAAQVDSPEVKAAKASPWAAGNTAPDPPRRLD
jgi:hypothetical protein